MGKLAAQCRAVGHQGQKAILEGPIPQQDVRRRRLLPLLTPKVSCLLPAAGMVSKERYGTGAHQLVKGVANPVGEGRARHPKP